MSQREIKSVLNNVCQQVWSATTADIAKQIIIDCLESSDIKEEDKDKMISELKKMTVLVKIQQYFANALLKFEGYGTSFK